ANGPTRFRLPPVIDDWHAELFLGPRERVRIATLTSEKHRAEVFQIVLSQVFTSMIFAFDGPKSSGRGEERAHIVLRDDAPERAGVRRADGFAFVKHGRVAVQQWSINDVRVTDGPTEIGSRPEHFAGLHAVDVLHAPLERDE